MAERQKSSFERNDLLGLVLFVPGAFLSVLVVMDLFHSGGGGWTGRLATAVVGALGHAAPLAAAVGLGAAGVAVYLRGGGASVWRHVTAVLGSALGVALLLGAVSEAAGGAFGRATGGWLAARAGEFLAVLAGLAATVVPAWLVWLRGMRRPGGIRTSDAPPEPPAPESIPDGVSSAEAEALVPDERFVSYMEEVWRHARATPQFRSAPPSPYPEDVRRKGQIPPGAKPLDASHDEAAQVGSYPAHAEPARSAAAPGGSYVSLGKDLAASAPSSRSDPTAAPAAERNRPAEAPAEGLGKAKAPLGYRAFFGQEPEARVPARTTERPPRPAWEETTLFDARTPAARPSRAGSALAGGDDTSPDADDEPAGLPAPIGSELSDEDLEDAEGLVADEEDADEGPADQYDEEDEEDDSEEGTEEAETLAEAEEESVDRETPQPLLEPTSAELEPSEPEIVLEPHPAPRPRRTGRTARESATNGPPARVAPTDHEDLVLQAGMLFLQHGRVAVSLLQRHFGLDFDQACDLLDELQDRGLIGPYLGGQRRDILLSAEQWMERVGSS